MERHPVSDRGARRRRAMGSRTPCEVKPLRAEKTGQNLFISFRRRHAPEQLVERSRPALRREPDPLIARRVDSVEGLGKETLLIGHQAVQVERETTPLLERRRLGDRVAERGGRGVDEGVFDAKVTGKDVVGQDVRSDFAEEPMTDGDVPCRSSAGSEGLAERRVRNWAGHASSAHRARPARSTKALARAGSTGLHHPPPTFSALATMTPSTIARMSATLSGVTPLPTSVGSVAAARMLRM